MISDTLTFLKKHLNYSLSLGTNDPTTEPVQFLDGNKMDPLVFPMGAVSLLLINLEQENTLRPPDLYRRTTAEGNAEGIQPEIRLNLYILFVAHFSHYEDALKKLSLILQHFQKYRRFVHEDKDNNNENSNASNHDNVPRLPANIEQLVVELTTLPFAGQNEVWNALRTTYHPSVLYKVKMVVFQDDTPVKLSQIVARKITIGGSTRVNDEQGNSVTRSS